MQVSKHAAARAYAGVLGQTKTAAMFTPETGQRALSLGKSLVEVGSVAVPIATLMAQGISLAAQKMTEASRKAKAYKQMMQENPHLLSHDQDLVQRYFNTLYRLNPTLAGDPTVAASFVNNQVRMSNPGAPHAAIYEQARQLYDPKSQQQQTYGKDLSAEIIRMGTMLRQDKSKELQGHVGQMKDLMGEQRDRFQGEIAGMRTDMGLMQKDLRDQQQRNKTLKQFAQRMKGQAQRSGGYGSP